ncbi:MAG TPA: anti-sigma factor [Candidatus Nitrosotenuis sp.]|jgi:anti-sigma factor (TIGR02949 family)|nr:anti-sigma factor [Candidatus Nitrosotenuis sp.]
MDCAQIVDSLSAYLDEELAADERQKVRQHLESCPACRGQLDELSRHQELLASLPRMPLPSGLYERVRREIQESALPAPVRALPRRAAFPRWSRSLAAAAAVLLLFLGLLVVLGRSQTQPGPAVAPPTLAQRHALEAGSALLGEPPLWSPASYQPGGLTMGGRRP